MEPKIDEVLNKELNFNIEDIKKASNLYPTPFHFYNGDKIVENGKSLMTNFQQYFPNYKNYFAVKATPNPSILKILKEQTGMGVDCSSLAELLLSEKVGFKGEEIMFTSNNTKENEYKKAYELGAIINLDDITQIEYLYSSLGNVMPELLSFRYNPGPLKSGNDIIGNPKDAKFGLTGDDLQNAYNKAKELGVKRFGLHCMVASNELDIDYFEETARLLFSTVATLSKQCGIQFEMVNLGGGIGIPYRPHQVAVNYQKLTERIYKAYKELILDAGLPQMNVVTECGRVITGPYGALITRAIHSKSTYKEYIGVDACMADLMRPGMYNAYHHVTVIDPKDPSKLKQYDLVGSLCENNDKFCVDRTLPEINRNDLIVIHDSGAHGHSMGFNYNGKLRSAEYLLLNNEIKLIRRAETYEDLFATLNF
ncbi:hypothetical protein DICPUDRAFT_45522 [Dictyostelium purpureum]|uniref:Diaminopimelate decarboxylase n=1 Tax=Dictyostelium purpureum TaxID=5786 RepID=F0ZAR1_DICPU|nr:uncharacterized protein DICPUDRAFT_45522 [Dictyostelium purpureum]EGC38930.1 hypothetical protein DICPUDRAFT_45522 [Dictyostelium purpureum]|eukprot:XP_003284495.1 hypothetical protein DICPUDRAFT_45522 [Dictyostelium purpureum]